MFIFIRKYVKDKLMPHGNHCLLLKEKSEQRKKPFFVPVITAGYSFTAVFIIDWQSKDGKTERKSKK